MIVEDLQAVRMRAFQEVPDLLQRHRRAPQSGDQLGTFELANPAVPVPGVVVYMVGKKQPQLGIEPKRTGRHLGQLSKASDGEKLCHGHATWPLT
jgi:hypothetical protein